MSTCSTASDYCQAVVRRQERIVAQLRRTYADQIADGSLVLLEFPESLGFRNNESDDDDTVSDVAATEVPVVGVDFLASVAARARCVV